MVTLTIASLCCVSCVALILNVLKYDNHGLFNGVNHILSIKSTKMKILNCKAVSILICKKILADIPGSETFNLIPHLLRLEPSFGRSSVTHKPTNPHTDSRIIYNR